MASSSTKILLLFAHVALCSCIVYNGPASTAIEHSSTGIARVPKQAILRRQTSALSICGYESGQAQSTIACDAGSSCGVYAVTALSSLSLIQDCCAATISPGAAVASPSAASCLVYTRCADFPATATGNPNILTCTSNASYCQSFTYPEVDAIGYGCDTTSDTTWRTVFLTPQSTPISSSTLAPPSSTESPSIISTESSPPVTSAESTLTGAATSSPTRAASPSPAAPAGPIQDLTPGQKAGIGTGCGCAFLFITFGIILRIRKQKAPTAKFDETLPADQVAVIVDEKSSADQVTPIVDEKSPADQVAAMLDENPPADQVVEVQGQESVMEEISSQGRGDMA